MFTHQHSSQTHLYTLPALQDPLTNKKALRIPPSPIKTETRTFEVSFWRFKDALFKQLNRGIVKFSVNSTIFKETSIPIS